MFVLHTSSLDILISVRDWRDDKILGHNVLVAALSSDKYFSLKNLYAIDKKNAAPIFFHPNFYTMNNKKYHSHYSNNKRNKNEHLIIVCQNR